MDLVGNVLRARFEAEARAGGGLTATVQQEIAGRVAFWKGITSMMINLGAVVGMCSFGAITQRLGRKPTFVISSVINRLPSSATTKMH